MQFADPKNDIAFRRIFGDENKKDILISFLNNILEFSGSDREITEIKLENPYQVPRLAKLKETILDIKATDKRNVHYIVEMQVIHTSAFEKRVQYYVAKAYSQQLKRAEDYPKLNQVIFLGFLDFEMFKGCTHYSTRHIFLEEKTNGNYFKDFELNFIELPKFTQPLDKLQDVKEKWIYFVKHAGDMEMIPKEMESPSELRKAFEAANQMTWTREELDAYDYKGMTIQDERGRMEYAVKVAAEEAREKALKEGLEAGLEAGRENGLKQGREEGRLEGRLEGREEGREEGLKQGLELGGKKEKLEIARRMLEQGLSVDNILALTLLLEDDIKDLLKR